MNINSIETEKSPEPPILKDSWFKGFVKGNSLWPQTNWGISMFTLQELLANPPKNYSDFHQSVLTPEQISVLSRMMTNMHRKKEIKSTVSTLMRSGERPISELRFNDIWRIARENSTYRINDFLGYLHLSDQLDLTFDQTLVKVLNPNDEFNKRYPLKQVVDSLCDALSDKEAVELSKKFRDSFYKDTIGNSTDEQRNSRNEVRFDIAKKARSRLTALKQQFPQISDLPLTFIFSNETPDLSAN